MDHPETIIRTRHQLGALMPSRVPPTSMSLAGRNPWTGHTQAAGPEGAIDTYDAADRLFLLQPTEQNQSLDQGAALICDWRA